MMNALDLLVAAARAAPSADNTQPWRLERQGNVLRVGHADRQPGGVFSPTAPATLLSIGALVENLAQASHALGTAARVDWSTTGREHPYYAAVMVDPSATAPAEATRLPLFERHTNRHPYRKQPLPDDVLEHASALHATGARVRMFRSAPDLRAIGGLVKAASEVRFQTRELHEWLAGSLRFGQEAERGDGLDVATLALPPGGAAFLRFASDWKRMQRLNQFGAHRLFAGMDARLITAGPAIAAVISQPGQQATLETGRLMQRVWISLNQPGLAVQPYYAISDQLDRLVAGRVPASFIPHIERLREAARSVFGLADGEVLQMLLRIGYPTRQPVRSRRLPREQIFVDDPDA